MEAIGKDSGVRTVEYALKEGGWVAQSIRRAHGRPAPGQQLKQVEASGGEE